MKKLLFFILLNSQVFAQQENWLQPSRFFPILEENINIDLLSGEGFSGTKSKIEPERIENFKHFGTKAKKIPTENGQITVKFLEEGTHLIILDEKSIAKNYESLAFNNYLETNDFYDIKRIKQKNVIETKFQSHKMLVQVGSMVDETYQQSTNQRLEIIPLSNPFDENSSTLSFKVLFDGETLKGNTVKHWLRDASGQNMEGVHTDKNGLVNFIIKRGLHLLTVTKMIDLGNGQYETHTNSLTFGKK